MGVNLPSNVPASQTTKNLQGAIDSNIGSSVDLGRQLVDAFSSTQREVESIQGAYSTIAGTKQREVDANFKAAQDALANSTRAAALPNAVTRVLGFFDSDFNPEVQNLKAKSAQLNITKAAQDMETARQLRDSALSTAESRLRAVSGAFNATNTVVNQLQSERQANFTKQSLGMDAARLGLQQEQQTWARQAKAVNNLTDEQLKAEIKLGDKSQFSSLLGQLQEEDRRRDGAKLTLRSATQAVQLNDVTHAATMKDKFLKESTINHLNEMLDAANKSGGTLDINGLKFTSRELQSQLAVAAKAQDEQIAQAVDRQAKGAQVAGITADAVRRADALGALNGGAVPPELANRVTSYLDSIKAAKDAGSPTAMAEQANNLAKLIDERVDAYTAGQKDDKVKAATKNFVQNYGRFSDQENALAVVGTNIGNPTAMTGTIYERAWGQLNTNFSKLDQNNFMMKLPDTKDKSGNPLAINVRKADTTEMLRAAAAEGNPAQRPGELLRSDMFGDYVRNVTQAFGQKNSDVAQFLDPKSASGWNEAMLGLQPGKKIAPQDFIVKLAEVDARNAIAFSQLQAQSAAQGLPPEQAANAQPPAKLVDQYLAALRNVDNMSQFLAGKFASADIHERAIGQALGVYDPVGVALPRRDASGNVIAQEPSGVSHAALRSFIDYARQFEAVAPAAQAAAADNVKSKVDNMILLQSLMPMFGPMAASAAAAKQPAKK